MLVGGLAFSRKEIFNRFYGVLLLAVAVLMGWSGGIAVSRGGKEDVVTATPVELVV